jgi:hypothetical protein
MWYVLSGVIVVHVQNLTSLISLLLDILSVEQARDSFEELTLNAFANERRGGENRALSSVAIPGMSASDVASMVNALAYVVRGCLEQKLDKDGAALMSALATSTEASEETTGRLVACWTTSCGNSAKESQSAFTIGQLDGMDWKLGVALSSSTCSQLVTPYVTLTFKVKDSNGGLRVKQLELTLSEFKGMSRQMSEVAAKMDRL